MFSDTKPARRRGGYSLIRRAVVAMAIAAAATVGVIAPNVIRAEGDKMAEKTPTRPDREPDVRIDVPAGVKIKQSELERIREFSRENHPGQSGKPLPKPMPGTPSDGQ